VRVREAGGGGEGVVAGSAVAYRRARGTSFWSIDEGNVEEWLHAEPGEAATGGALAAWEVEGASLRQRGAAVDVVDGAGVARIHVTAPRAFGAGGRPLDARLTARGARIELAVEPTADAVLVDPAWAAVPPMSTTRLGPPSVLLPDGKAFVAGGMANGGGCIHEQTSAEIYDPTASSWTDSHATTSEPQLYGFLLLLPSGKALIGGGLDCNDATETTELYDPVADAWSPAAPMIYYGQSVATLLPSGEVLVAGSFDMAGVNIFPTVQTYDPTADAWSPAAPMLLARSGHTATLLPDGRVLVAGGEDAASVVVDECELYDPMTDTWSLAAPMSTARLFHAATLLGDGTVLVVGGAADAALTVPLAGAEIYDPTTDTWKPGPSLATAVVPNAATLLDDGTVLVDGGYATTAIANAERFDPESFTWLDAASMTVPRSSPATLLLGDGSVLVAGGFDDTFMTVASAERFTLVPQGGACTAPGECASRFCVEGVCCDTACGSDPCHACAAADGATADGTCTPLTGPACDDGDLCTLTAACAAGTCTAQTSTPCTSLDPCHPGGPGACDPATGLCSFPPAVDGTPCDDHDACTQTDTCQGGVCVGASPRTCLAQDTCHDAACDPLTGACVQSNKPDDTPCDDDDVCTLDDTCQSGTCMGGTAVVCVAEDACHAAGVCDPMTGCTNPVLPTCNGSQPGGSGALADGSLCADDATCTSGHCARGVCCDTACTGTCFSCALPGARGTCTAEPEGIDLNGDCGVGPNCISTCAPGGGACTGAMAGTQCLPARCVDDHTLLGPAICPSVGAPCPEGASAATDCSPAACLAAFGACGPKTCRTVADCAPGFVCDPSFLCNPPPPIAGGSDGCRYAPGRTGSPAGGAAASLLVALALARLSSRRRGRSILS
jgi:hypothetical protein